MSQWHKGNSVRWFDKLSGEGVVVGDDGQSYVHYSTIVSQKERSPTTKTDVPRRNLNAGNVVKFLVYENLYSKRVLKVSEV